MHATDELIALLKAIRLSGILQSMPIRVEQAIEEKLSYPEFLFRLLSDEKERRSAHQFEKRLKQAGFDRHKTLEDFDFQFNPHIDKARVIDLAAGGFIHRKRNALIVGNTGVGKSHLAQAIGHRACLAGFKVLFLEAHQLLSQLRAARADDSYDDLLKGLTRWDLLIIDDLGLRTLSPEESVDLYEVIRSRYEVGSMILTSNRAIEEWPGLFADALMASAALDRLLHEATLLVIEGDSYRNPPPAKRQAQQRVTEKGSS